MKRWAFVDCLNKVNFENIDLDGYERIVLFSSEDFSLPAGEVDSVKELTVIKTETKTQQQMTIALTYNVSKYDLIAPSNIHFDIYSDDIQSPSLDVCLLKDNRYCQLFNLPPGEKITLSRAVDDFIIQICTSYIDKRIRPRSLSLYLYLLDSEWRFLRGRVKSEEILKQMDFLGLINYASNGIYFKF